VYSPERVAAFVTEGISCVRDVAHSKRHEDFIAEKVQVFSKVDLMS
jgi:hypothetical protein